MPENAVELIGLTKTYASRGGQPEKKALTGIDLGIPQGSIFGLLGPNGAGKSTTINILAGLVIKTTGTVRIWGFDQDSNPRQSRASIGVVPQEPNIDPFFTPRAALEVQAGLYGVPKAERRTDEILAAVGLTEQADAYSRTLSGGMRRRLLIAKALVHAPPVLVLDEPTAGVDIELRAALWAYVRELNEAGTTIILTTHYLEEAQEMCDRIGIIDEVAGGLRRHAQPAGEAGREVAGGHARDRARDASRDARRGGDDATHGRCARVPLRPQRGARGGDTGRAARRRHPHPRRRDRRAGPGGRVPLADLQGRARNRVRRGVSRSP